MDVLQPVGDASEDGVVRKLQVVEVGEVDHFGGDRSVEPVVGELEAGDTPARIGLNAVPFAQWGVGEPVRLVLPVRSSGGVVKRDQRLPVQP